RVDQGSARRVLPGRARWTQLSTPRSARRVELLSNSDRRDGGHGMTLNREVLQRDPTANPLPNDGVAKVGRPRTDEEWRVLEWELKNFVCTGEYERGLERMLSTYLANLDRDLQPAAWISGFYGSGKSHLVRVLEQLWLDET